MSFVNIVIFGINLSGREDLTDQAGVLRQADAGESVVSVLAEAAVETRIGIALVDFLRAIFARVSRSTCALEVVDSILAGPSVGTGGVLAVVVVVLTVPTDEPVLADTLVVIDEGEANALILTRVRLAQICHFFAVPPLESWRAGTSVAGHAGRASGSIFTGIVIRANIGVRAELAIRTIKSRGASAGIIVVEPSLKKIKKGHRILPCGVFRLIKFIIRSSPYLTLASVPAGKLVALGEGHLLTTRSILSGGTDWA